MPQTDAAYRVRASNVLIFDFYSLPRCLEPIEMHPVIDSNYTLSTFVCTQISWILIFKYGQLQITIVLYHNNGDNLTKSLIIRFRSLSLILKQTESFLIKIL